MNRTVFVLGAGFSAPLGIPLISNFLEKSKDLYQSDRQKYGHFKSVYETIRELSYCQQFYKIDLFNIEDILSLLTMHSTMTGDHEAEDRFCKFLVDVIEAHTPPATERVWNAGQLENLFGTRPWFPYCSFVASILGYAFEMVRSSESDKPRSYRFKAPRTESDEYAVVTLNYDLVLELMAEQLRSWFGTKIRFRRTNDEYVFHQSLAKLHGSIDGPRIVPPTWNKTLRDDAIRKEWEFAHQLLTDANHIIFVGYSLPEGDNYIRFLLRSAIVSTEHLKSIGVLCLDDTSKSVETRYQEFVCFPNFRFHNQETMSLLHSTWAGFGDSSWPVNIEMNGLSSFIPLRG